MTLPSPRPPSAGGREPDSIHQPPGSCPWAAEQLRRVLRLQEGSGPAAESRIHARTRMLLSRMEAELGAGAPSSERVTDHLWSLLLRKGQGAAARFFRPYRAGKGPVLWVRLPDGRADPLARERVEALLERRCQELEDSGLDAARIHHHCRGQLRNRMGETELARVLDLTSPAQTTVLGRLYGDGQSPGHNPQAPKGKG